MAQRVGRGIALLFHDRGTRRAGPDGSGKSHLRPGFDSRTVRPVASRYTDALSRHTRSESLYRRAIPAHPCVVVKFVCARRNALPVEMVKVFNSQGNRKLMLVLREFSTNK